jgi:amino-acid N-acetyltransferase
MIILMAMKVRIAKVSDAKVIHSLISTYAEQDRMLFRSLADIYENLQTFLVAQQGRSVIGCCAVEVIWSDMAEIKSLAVKKGHQGEGIGTKLVLAALEQGEMLGVPKVIALTMEPKFFVKNGFKVVNKGSLPMKLWSDCARCPKQQSCDEIAVIKRIR